MQPFEYFKFRYYEKWLMGISQFFIDQGYLSADELDQKTDYYRANPDAALPDQPNPASPSRSTPILRKVIRVTTR